MRERRCSYTEAKRIAEQEAQCSFAAPSGSAIPAALAERLRLQAPERVRQDAPEPGKPKTQVVIDDGAFAGQTVATCQDIADAALIVEMWNWARTLSPNEKAQR